MRIIRTENEYKDWMHCDSKEQFINCQEHFNAWYVFHKSRECPHCHSKNVSYVRKNGVTLDYSYMFECNNCHTQYLSDTATGMIERREKFQGIAGAGLFLFVFGFLTLCITLGMSVHFITSIIMMILGLILEAIACVYYKKVIVKKQEENLNKIKEYIKLTNNDNLLKSFFSQWPDDKTLVQLSKILNMPEKGC